MIKKTILWSGIGIMLLIIAVFFILVVRLYQHDVKALTDFIAAYQKYDQSIADFSGPLAANPLSQAAADQLSNNADQALLDLDTAASVRISSLIKYDKDLMLTSQEIAGLSSKELAALKSYQSAAASQNADLDQLSKAFKDLTQQRQAAYSLFRKYAEIND